MVQCYRGVELVSGGDELLLSTFDGMDVEVMQSKGAHSRDIGFAALALWGFCALTAGRRVIPSGLHNRFVMYFYRFRVFRTNVAYLEDVGKENSDMSRFRG